MSSTLFVDTVTQSAAAWFNDADTAAYSYLTGTAGTNTVTATGPNSMSSYAAGQTFRFIPANTNTGATTINITANSVSLGAKNIFSGGVALTGGELVQNIPVLLIYDGTQFHISGIYAIRGSFTGTLTGCTTSPTAIINYTIIGNVAHMDVPSFSATSNATTMTVTGAPNVIKPTTQKTLIASVQDNTGTPVAALFSVTTNAVLSFSKDLSSGSFTSSGTKGFAAMSFCYTLV